MRSKKSKTGLLIFILLILAAAEIAAGTCAMLLYRSYMNNPDKSVVEEYDKEDPADNEADIEDQNDDKEDGSDIIDDPDSTDEEAEEDADDQDADDQDDSEKDDDDKDDDDKDVEQEKKKDYIVMVVQASDNFAAVRTGRGVQYQEVGRITNGHRVALKDLENGWYKIARGKFKGYYAHQSSFVPAQ